MTVKLGSHSEVRLPPRVTRRLRLREGAELEVLPLGAGIFIVPAGRIQNERRYFYTDEWQAKEAEADQAIAHGKVKSFDDVEALIRELHGR